ncbi:redoxin domain-containing protein [Chitinophaga lutea]
MQKLLIFLICLCGASAAHAQGYNIALQLKGYTSGTVYLGHYMGKTTYVMDSASLDPGGKATLAGKETQPGGIYLIVLPGKKQYFEILLDKQQHFSIVADTSDLIGKTIFTNSPDNQQFSDYNRFITSQSATMAEVQQLLAAAKNAEDSARARPAMDAIGKKLQQYRQDIIAKQPKTLLAAIFRAMREPEVPAMPRNADGSLDSTFPYRYYKAHFWDDADLSDGRLVRTPVLEARLNRYFNQLVAPVPDSAIVEADKIIALTKNDRESFKFVTWWLTQFYEGSNIMGMDAVFVHLVEKYYVTKKAYWVNDEQREKIIARAYEIAPNLIGQKAAQLILQDSTGAPVNLYNVRSKYTVLVFWDPTCGHCVTEVPKLDSAYKARWKQQGVTMIGVKTEGTKAEWTAFIQEKKLTGWIHAWDPKYTSNYRKLYDVYSTPVVYLLDENKKILAKRLGTQQLDEFLSRGQSSH